MKKIKDMGEKELTIFIIIMATVFFIFGIILGSIVVYKQVQDDFNKINFYAQDCFINFNNDFQGFKTCFWAKTHIIEIARIS